MGMYTEIYVKVSLKSNTPQDVIQTLSAMMGEGDEPAQLPDHELFTKGRWNFMLRCSSYYHMPSCVGKFWYDDIAKQWFLLNRSDLKNYEGEIESFFDWISPYVEQNYDKHFIGYELYEEDSIPSMYYLTNQGLVKEVP